MHQLIYCSEATSEVSSESVKNILEIAKSHNSKNQVTGVLFYSKKYFLQLLEGPCSEINATYNRIMADDRHQRLTILSYDEIYMRRFNQWKMGVASDHDINKDAYFRFGMNEGFNPFELGAESANLFLEDLCSSALIF